MNLFLFTLYLCLGCGQAIFLTDKDHTFKNPTDYQIVYAKFSEENTRNRQFFAANFLKGDKMKMEVFIPVATKDEIVVLQVTGHGMGFPKSEMYVHDPANVLAMKKVFKVTATAQVNTTIVIEVVGQVKGAHYAVTIGERNNFNIFDYSTALPYTVQRIRTWTRTLYFPYIFVAFTFLYLIAWPLSRTRSWALLPRLAALSYVAWILDVFLQYFVTIQFTSKKSILTFLFHILPNTAYVYTLLFSDVAQSNRQKEVFLGVGLVSLIFGGAGGYIGTSLLLFASLQKYFQFIDTRKAKEKIICKV
ncbi:MAG: hypothetical protein CMO44_18780 [Verrucomicrobiales bacterium]|nr:hypothetical protein [Verrucomicrobiales bacterium]